MPKFEREIEIDAPIEKVWEALIKPEYWPQWLPGIGTVTNAVTTAEGVTFDFNGTIGSGQGTITKFEPMRKLEILTQVDKDKDLHKFELKATGGLFGLKADECKVEYELDTLAGGGILGNFVSGGNPADAIRVKKTMHLFRKLVESL
ncbi:MAG TPA: SRPBCC family protein [Anaerolineaceae bacterium]|nr:SRPBCC family protein [Anaerolineaceae bacterium]